MSEMKKLLAFILSAAMSLNLTACSVAVNGETKKESSGNPEIKLTIGHQSTEGESRYSAFEEFKKVIEGENVGITVDIYPAAQLVSTDRDSIEAISLNELDMTCVADVQFAPSVNEFYVFNADYLFKDFDDAKVKLEGEPGKALIDACDAKDNGIMIAGFLGGAPRIFWNNIKPVKTLKDFDGIKSRTAENPINVKELEGVGCIPTPMAWAEMYTGLQQGTIEALVSSPPPIIQQGIIEVLKNATNTNHSYNINIMLFNQNTYNSFTDEQKAAYQKAVTAAINLQWKEEGAIMESCLQKLRDLEAQGKFEFTELTDEELKPIKEAMIAATEPLVIEKCGKDILDKFRK